MTLAPSSLRPRSVPRRPRPGARLVALLCSAAVLVVLVVLSVAFGTRQVSLADVLAASVGDTSTAATAAVAARVPRTILATLVGAALGLSGALMQGITRNPLADPGMLGITPGASLVVVSGIAFFGLSSPTLTVWLAIAGAAGTALLVYFLGSMGRGGATVLKLALAGAAVAAAVSSCISAILLPRADVMNSFRFWQIGGVGGADFGRISQVLPFLAVGLVASACVARPLNALALGDDVAVGLGERVMRTRIVAGAAAVLLCGAATAVAGPIAFVGLVVPHACRLLVGNDHRWLLPFTAVGGAALLVGADILGRIIARPEEVDVGIVTAVIGAPLFIAIVRRHKAYAL